MRNFLVLGGSGNLGLALQKNKFFKSRSFFPTKKQINILNEKKIKSFLKTKKINLIINCAAIARLSECEKNKKKAFDINVIGCLNLLKAIKKVNKNIKLLHLSSDGVYPCTKGNYDEKSKLKPYNYYGFTKILSEKVLKSLDNLIITRTRFFNKNNIPFKYSATDSYSSSLEINQLVRYLEKLIKKDFRGIINVGGKKISDYNLYKKYKKKLNKCKLQDIQKELEFKISKDASMNCDLLYKVIYARK